MDPTGFLDSHWLIVGVLVVCAVLVVWLVWECLSDLRDRRSQKAVALPELSHRTVTLPSPPVAQPINDSALSGLKVMLRELGGELQHLRTQVAGVRSDLSGHLRLMDDRVIGELRGVESRLSAVERQVGDRATELSTRIGSLQEKIDASLLPRSTPGDVAPSASDDDQLEEQLRFLDRIGRDVLIQVAPRGRAADLARTPALREWLTEQDPRVTLIHLVDPMQNVWLLLVLTIDGKNGVGVPALDSVIGPGEVSKWFDSGRYDGTQALLLEHVSALPRARYDTTAETWVPTVRGRLDIETRK